MALRIQKAGQWFANAVPVIAGHGRCSTAGPEGALEQPLAIDHQIELPPLQRLNQRSHGLPGLPLPELPAPLAPGQPVHLRDARMQFGDSREGRLHQPIDFEPGVQSMQVADGRQCVDHIAHAGGLDDQQLQRLAASATNTGLKRGSLYILNCRYTLK